jgi:two-component system LytT family response regulator
MNALRVVIVDDEAPARERLGALLARHPEVDVVGEAADVDAAVELCRRVAPDMVFLDVQLRSGTGFDVLERLTTPALIVFVTAYGEQSARAAQVDAFEFLLKPVNPRHLATTIARALDHVGRHPSGD